MNSSSGLNSKKKKKNQSIAKIENCSYGSFCPWIFKRVEKKSGYVEYPVDFWGRKT